MGSDEQLQVLRQIAAERTAQDRKFGPQPVFEGEWREVGHTYERFLAILLEEVGEVAKEVVELPRATCATGKTRRRANIREELVQTAAVCVAWVEAIDTEVQDRVRKGSEKG